MIAVNFYIILSYCILLSSTQILHDRAATRYTSASRNVHHRWKYIHFDATLSFSIGFISLYISGMFHLESCFVLSSKCRQWGAVRCSPADNVTDLSWWGQTSRLTGTYLNKSEISKITILLWKKVQLYLARLWIFYQVFSNSYLWISIKTTSNL